MLADDDPMRQMLQCIHEVRAESLALQVIVSRLILEVAAIQPNPNGKLEQIHESLRFMRDAIDQKGGMGHQAAHEAIDRIIEGATV